MSRAEEPVGRPDAKEDDTAYTAQKHLKPKALSGISDEQIDQHWQLYEAYVKNTNEILEELGEAESGSHHWSELKRRLGFEFNGMVLHEYYFGNLSAGGSLSPQSALGDALAGRWADVDAWREDFAKTGAMRGIGWVILYHEPATGSLFNWWISDHEVNHPAGLNPSWTSSSMRGWSTTERARKASTSMLSSTTSPGRWSSSASRTAATDTSPRAFRDYFASAASP